jgi:hypothetical protein
MKQIQNFNPQLWPLKVCDDIIDIKDSVYFNLWPYHHVLNEPKRKCVKIIAHVVPTKLEGYHDLLIA